MRTLVEIPDEEEERARRDAVVHHLQDRAVHRLGTQGREAEHDEAEVRDRRIGDEPFHVGLCHAHERPVDDPGDAERSDDRRSIECGLREERHRVADEAKGAHLQHHACEQDRTGSRRFRVRVGQPGVERPDRHLDREGEREGPEEPALRLQG